MTGILALYGCPLAGAFLLGGVAYVGLKHLPYMQSYLGSIPSSPTQESLPMTYTIALVPWSRDTPVPEAEVSWLHLLERRDAIDTLCGYLVITSRLVIPGHNDPLLKENPIDETMCPQCLEKAEESQ